MGRPESLDHRTEVVDIRVGPLPEHYTKFTEGSRWAVEVILGLSRQPIHAVTWCVYTSFVEKAEAEVFVAKAYLGINNKVKLVGG